MLWHRLLAHIVEFIADILVRTIAPVVLWLLAKCQRLLGKPLIFMNHEQWQDTLFIHYEVEPESLGRALPNGLKPDLLDGKAYVGIVLLTESGIHPGSQKFIMGLSHDAMNVRTYVVNEQGEPEPGIYFFNLDCTSALATLGARGVFGLPYTLASCTRHHQCTGTHHFRGSRCSSPAAAAVAECKVENRIQRCDRQSDFLVERYCLYHKLPDPWLGAPSRLLRGKIQHTPWKLKPVRLESINETLLQSSLVPCGVRILNSTSGPGRATGGVSPDLVHFGNTESISFSFFTEV